MSATTTVESLVDLARGRVHRAVYTDATVFEEEMQRIFQGTWVFLAHESELPAPGDYVASSLGRTPVIVARGANGELSVLHNRCRHRGAQVCQAAKGNANFFRCEYHGWTYRNTGELTGVPYRQGYPDYESMREDLGLVRVPRVANYRGFIFGSANPDVPAIEEHLAGAREYVDLFVEQCGDYPLEARNGTQRVSFPGNWKLQLENGADGYHANFTHRSFMQIVEARSGHRANYLEEKAPAVAKALGNGHAVLDQRTSMGTHYVDRVRMSPEADEILAELERELPQEQLAFLLNSSAGIGFNLTVFPNLQLIGTHVRRIVPRAFNDTAVMFTPLSAAGAPDGINALRYRAHEFFYSPAGFGASDDTEIFRRVGFGLHSDDEWLLLSRGLARQDVKGDGQIVGHITDEVTQRGEYAEWLRLMASPSDQPQRPPMDASVTNARDE